MPQPYPEIYDKIGEPIEKARAVFGHYLSSGSRQLPKFLNNNFHAHCYFVRTLFNNHKASLIELLFQTEQYINNIIEKRKSINKQGDFAAAISTILRKNNLKFLSPKINEAIGYTPSKSSVTLFRETINQDEYLKLTGDRKINLIFPEIKEQPKKAYIVNILQKLHEAIEDIDKQISSSSMNTSNPAKQERPYTTYSSMRAFLYDENSEENSLSEKELTNIRTNLEELKNDFLEYRSTHPAPATYTSFQTSEYR